MSEERSPLETVVEEARRDLVPPQVDWSAVERGLEARLATEDRAPRVAHVRSGGTRGRIVALGLAAAAAAVLVLGRDREAPIGGIQATQIDVSGSGGTLRGTEGGEVRIGGVVAESGQGLRTGDVVEVGSARAVFERPRKVTWLLEGENGPGRGRARVTAMTEPVVIALEEGAIEAQVAKSEAPETFAVDVSAAGRTVRVAVHGTHLRVTRAGSRVVVDLSEGVVSIGVPPRTGPTYGQLVTAPAHVELDVADPATAVRVDHERASVRAPVSLGPGEPALASAKGEPAPPPKTRPAATPLPAVAPPSGVVEAPARKPDAQVAAPPPPAVSSSVIAAAVRECVVAARKGRPEIRVTVSSTLRLRVAPDGEIQSAVFDPPLSPEVQGCAATKIYGAKLDTTGAVEVPIQLSY